MTRKYPWRRYWLPFDFILVDDDGYLPDPAEKYLASLNPGISDLSALREKPCKILFAESGMGKSYAVKADAEVQQNQAVSGNRIVLVDIGGATSLTDLQSLILNDPVIREWNATGVGTLNIHLDSLDEAIPAYNSVAKGLASVVRQLRREGLRLTIACRTGEFPPVLDDELESLFGPDNVSRWQLLPLSRGDIRKAAEQDGIDADAFMEAIWRGNLQPLAARPITLDLLFRATRAGDGLLSDVRALYERGCRELVSEYSGSSRSTQPHRLNIDQRMAVAARVACVTVLGAQIGINADPTESPAVGTVAAREIAGEQEMERGNSFGVGEDDVLEVLRTGLFTAIGKRFRWVHKSYAEFMASRQIRVSGMPTRNKVALITAGGRVPAPLRGIAGWLAALDGDVRSKVLRTDPEALLRSDLSLATDGQKEEIVSWLIREGEAGSPLLYEFGIAQKYRNLQHPQLGAQLEAVIESSNSVLARKCAIDIADACGVEALQPRLATLALDGREPLHLRIASASSVSEHGNIETRARLLPLIVTTVTADEEGLKVQALEAVWPKLCSWDELKNALGGSDYSLTTGLGRFVGFDLVEDLKLEDWAPALMWLAGAAHPVGSLYAWAKFGDRLMDKAGRSADAMTHRAVVDLAYARLSDFENMFVDLGNTTTEHEPWPEASRRAVAAGLVPRLADKVYAASRMVNTEKPLLIAADFDFVVESWKSGKNDERVLWQTILAYLVRWDEPQNVKAALAKTSALPALHGYLRDWQTRLGNRQQEGHDESEHRSNEKSRIRETRIGEMREALSASQNEPAAFARLLYIMSWPVDSELGHVRYDAISQLPGWELLNSGERTQLVETGKLFLERARPHVWRGLRHGHMTNYAGHGHSLLLELFRTRRDYLDQMSQALWDRWVPGVIVTQCFAIEDDPAWREGLLTLGVRKSESRAIRTLAVALRRGRGHRVISVIKSMAQVIRSPQFEAALVAALRSPQVDKYIYGEVMQLLLARENQDALRIIDENTRRIAKAPDTELPRLAWDAALHLRHSGAEAWPGLWNIFQARLYSNISTSRLDPELSDRLIKLRTRGDTMQRAWFCSGD